MLWGVFYNTSGWRFVLFLLLLILKLMRKMLFYAFFSMILVQLRNKRTHYQILQFFHLLSYVCWLTPNRHWASVKLILLWVTGNAQKPSIAFRMSTPTSFRSIPSTLPRLWLLFHQIVILSCPPPWATNACVYPARSTAPETSVQRLKHFFTKIKLLCFSVVFFKVKFTWRVQEHYT